MKNNNPSTKAMIKCKFSNEIHKLIEGIIYEDPTVKYKRKKKLTDLDKIKIAEMILDVHYKTSNELVSFLYENRMRKKVKKLREEKNKTLGIN